MRIHPSAVVSPRAVIHSGVDVGPFCVVEAGAVLGQGCRLEGRVTIKADTILGRDCVVCEGVVLGGGPQHLSPPEHPGRVVVGERCVIRENATIHRAMKPEGETRLGNDCYLMVGAHVAHDCRVGSRVILTNNVMLGGHVEVGDRAVLGGGAAVHQHCRIGRLAMIGGCSKVVQDVPPFMLADGPSAMIVGLNRVGLKRSGLSDDEIRTLKGAYRTIYRQGLPFAEMVTALEAAFAEGAPAELAAFFRGGKRGFVQERRSPPGAAIRLHDEGDEDADETAQARRAA